MKATTTFFYFMAVLMMGAAMTLLTACSDNDDTTSEDDMSENFEDPVVEPTADAMTLTLHDKTYVYDGSYSGEGKALVNRVTDRATWLGSESTAPNEEVRNIILHDSNIASLKTTDFAALIMVLSQGGSVVVAEPTIDNLKYLVGRLRGVIAEYREGGNHITAKYVVQMLSTEALERIVMWTDNFDFSVYLNEEGKGDYMSLIIFREEDSYVAYRDAATLTDYQYGQKADRAAMWINVRENEAQQQMSRMAAAQMMATRAGGEAEQYVDKIAKSLDFTYDMGMQIDGPKGYSHFHNCTLTLKVWTAYSKEQQCDVYCVTQMITAYNQDLNCGPTKDTKWYNGKNWGPWKELDKKTSRLRSDVFGPYMKKIYTRCELDDGGRSVKTERYAPQNSTSGGTTETNGFTFGLGANASVSANGPQGMLSTSMSWSHSVSKFNADLSMTASPSAGGAMEWTYEAPRVASHYGLIKSHYHDFPKQIQVTTCTVEQAWVWTVAGSTSKTVIIKPTFLLQDDWLTYDRAFTHPAEAYSHYISMGDVRTITPIVINCPPRFYQTWSMSVKTDAVGADVVKIKDYLTNQLNQYCLASSVFYTVRPDHKASYNEGKSIDEFDEIGRFIVVAKDAFANNAGVRDILREAGKVGGVPDDGSYTIVWRQTDAGINSDSEEFTFSMAQGE